MSLRIFASSIYLDIIEETGIRTAKVDEVLQLSKGFGTLIAIDISSRSTLWNDNQTNSKAKTLEKYLISRDLHITKEESEITTFQRRRGRATWTLRLSTVGYLKMLMVGKLVKVKSALNTA